MMTTKVVAPYVDVVHYRARMKKFTEIRKPPEFSRMHVIDAERKVMQH